MTVESSADVVGRDALGEELAYFPAEVAENVLGRAMGAGGRVLGDELLSRDGVGCGGA
jgi:hypothetical protein